MPVEHDVMPLWQGSPGREQGMLAVHALHVPALQTWFRPQVVPSATNDNGLSAQTEVPVAHEVVPL